MTNFKAKLATSIATATLLAAAFVPAAFAATTTTITGTGAFSLNGVTVNHTNTTSVGQTNYQTVLTLATLHQKTGKNSSAFNVGTGSTVTSGATHATVNTTVYGNANSATLTSPCGCTGTTTSTISNTGAFSYNAITVNDTNTTSVGQSNNSGVQTIVDVHQNTGDNSSSFNVGGSSAVTSGGATATVTTTVGGNTNTLTQ